MATSETCTLSLHDALPILERVAELFAGGPYLYSSTLGAARQAVRTLAFQFVAAGEAVEPGEFRIEPQLHLVCAAVKVDRKSTRLNSSHMSISYAVFCLKKT